MTASTRRTVTVVVAALGLAFLLVWAANAGPEDLLAGEGSGTVVEQVEQPEAQEREDDEAGSGDTDSGSPTRNEAGAWVRDITGFLLLVAGLLVTGLVLRQLLLRLRSRLAEERLVVPLEPLPDLEVARAALQREGRRQLDALAGSDVRNGIVSCWVVFEEAAAEAGVPREPAETASDFVVRFLRLLDVDPRPVGELSTLFLEARFSSHELSPDAAERAGAALRAIHRDLALTGSAS